MFLLSKKLKKEKILSWTLIAWLKIMLNVVFKVLIHKVKNVLKNQKILNIQIQKILSVIAEYQLCIQYNTRKKCLKYPLYQFAIIITTTEDSVWITNQTLQRIIIKIWSINGYTMEMINLHNLSNNNHSLHQLHLLNNHT
jgi:hypothetical protein